MEIEFTQKIGQTTLRLRMPLEVGDRGEQWAIYQEASELWQSIVEYEIGLLPEDQQAGASFKKLRKS